MKTALALLLAILLIALPVGCAEQGVEFNAAPVGPFAPAQNSAGQAPAAAPEPAPAALPNSAAVVEQARARAAADPMNWRVFDELGLAYYRAGSYDEAIAAFEQAISLHPVTTILETERKQQKALDEAAEAKQAAEREATTRARQEQANQVMGAIGGMMGGMGGSLGRLGQMAAMASNVAQAANSAPGLNPEPQGPRAVVESQLKPRRELASLYDHLGRAQYAKRAYGDAIKSFDDVVSLDPSHTGVLDLEGESYYHLGNYGKCVAYTERYMAISGEGRSLKCLLRVSDAFRAVGLLSESDISFAAAISEGKKAAARQPNDVMVISSLAQAYIADDRYEEALVYYEKALALRPNAPDLAMGLAQCQFGLGRCIEAKETLAKMQAAPQPPRTDMAYVWYAMGRLDDALNIPEEARNAYGKSVAAFETAGGDPPIWMAVSYAGIGQHDRAISMLLDSLAKNGGRPESFVDWFRLALVFDKAGKPAEAIEALDRCLEFRPQYAFGVALQESLAAKYAPAADEAVARSNAALTRQDGVAAVQQLGLAYALTPRGERKVALQQKLLGLVAALPSPVPMTLESQNYFLRGNAMLKEARELPDVELAVSEYRRALVHSPWAVNIYLGLSAACSACQRFQQAADYLKLFLTASPNTKNVDEVLSRLYEMEVQHEQDLRALAALCPK